MGDAFDLDRMCEEAMERLNDGIRLSVVKARRESLEEFMKLLISQLVRHAFAPLLAQLRLDEMFLSWPKETGVFEAKSIEGRPL